MLSVPEFVVEAQCRHPSKPNIYISYRAASLHRCTLMWFKSAGSPSFFFVERRHKGDYSKNLLMKRTCLRKIYNK